jgi:hypothetical protein
MVARTILFSGLAIVAVYAVLCATLAPHLGRTHPALAGLLRPPSFSYHQYYDSGDVLNFRIGEIKSSVQSAIQKGGFRVEVSCWGDSRSAGIDLYSSYMIRESLARENKWCISKERLLLSFEFLDGTLRAIKMDYVAHDYVT